MATSNELFRDALLRRQIALASFERGLQTDIMDLLDKTERDLRVELADRLDKLVGKDFGATVNSRLNVLANAIGKIRAGAFDEAADLWDSSMQDLAVAETEYLDRHLKDVSPVKLDTVMPDPVQLAGIVAVQPMQGKVLGDWADHIQDRDLARIMDAVKIGMAQGEPTDDIIRRVLGSQSLDGADGVLQMTRRDIAAVTQTAISTVANEAREEYYGANEDILSKEQWVATLDDSTCPECGDLDGEEFDVGEGDMPPIHFNCRCVRVPVIDGAALGDRPSNAAMADELDGLEGEERSAKIAELVGTVPTSVNYGDWLGGQTEAFQDHVLGPTRAALFRDGGLTLDKFTNANGNTYNLDQLRALEPEAFRRAGL